MASTHTAIIKLADGREVFQSYGVIVAAFIPAHISRFTDQTTTDGKFISGYVRTDARYSVTTSKHMNQCAGRDAATVPHAVLLALTSPVESRE